MGLEMSELPDFTIMSKEQIGEWFGQTANAWNRHPTPFTWHGKRW